MIDRRNNKILVILIIILLIVVMGLVGYIIYDKTNEPTINTKTEEKKKIITNKEEITKEKEVDINNLDNDKVNKIIKEQLIELAKYSELTSDRKLAEVHVELGKYIENDIAFYELYAHYGAYSKKENEIVMQSGSSSPVLIGITKDYSVYKVEVPKDGSQYASSLNNMFKEDIAKLASNVDEMNRRIDEVAQIQLAEYFK